MPPISVDAEQVSCSGLAPSESVTPSCLCSHTGAVPATSPLRAQLENVSWSSEEACLAVSRATQKLFTQRVRRDVDERAISLWMRRADEELSAVGWQKESGLTGDVLVIIYTCLREIISPHPEKLTNVDSIRSLILTVQYIAISYTGPEISYIHQPFKLAGVSDSLFWSRTIKTSLALSSLLLRLHRDRDYFLENQELLLVNGCRPVRLSHRQITLASVSGRTESTNHDRSRQGTRRSETSFFSKVYKALSEALPECMFP